MSVEVVGLEAVGQFVGVGENLFDSAGHGNHFTNFLRAGVECTITTSPAPARIIPTYRMLPSLAAPIAKSRSSVPTATYMTAGVPACDTTAGDGDRDAGVSYSI